VVGKAGFEPATSASRTLFWGVCIVYQCLPILVVSLLIGGISRVRGCRRFSAFLSVACPTRVQSAGALLRSNPLIKHVAQGLKKVQSCLVGEATESFGFYSAPVDLIEADSILDVGRADPVT
jgi:hypothetical protein